MPDIPFHPGFKGEVVPRARAYETDNTNVKTFALFCSRHDVEGGNVPLCWKHLVKIVDDLRKDDESITPRFGKKHPLPRWDLGNGFKLKPEFDSEVVTQSKIQRRMVISVEVFSSV